MKESAFFTKFLKAKQNELPFVIFKYPGIKSVKGYIQSDDRIDETPIDRLSGFAFAPFNSKERTVVFAEDNCTKLTTDVEISKTVNVKRQSSIQEDFDAKYQKLIKKGITFLSDSDYEKVVLSRRIIQPILKQNFIEIFKKLMIFENAFIYCWSHPKIGMWIGASPETLVSIKHTQFSTMSLAGTKEYKGEFTKDWTSKEKYEQKLVTNYLVDKLKEFNLDISDPFTVKAGNVVHLRTDIRGELKNESKIASLVKLIHPTPAICGVPTVEAKNFILDNEGYNRSFYTGYLGEVNVKGYTKLHVNLRCMELTTDQAIIYVGGGITRQSDPKSEWEETCIKSQLMLNLLTSSEINN